MRLYTPTAAQMPTAAASEPSTGRAVKAKEPCTPRAIEVEVWGTGERANTCTSSPPRSMNERYGAQSP
ncbi:hypothetical protein RIB2604_01005740 [Aspergillus luchuensis]|nr:hypothetical protein RIB2604_01005740 [Aspergillus luchuensis]